LFFDRLDENDLAALADIWTRLGDAHPD
jgi:hypothetical protein